MVLTNSATYVHFNSVVDQDPPPSSSSAAASSTGNLLASPHAPPQRFHGYRNNNVPSAVLHGFIPRVYGTPIEAAREATRAYQQGLSLSLSSEQQQKSRDSILASNLQGFVSRSKYLMAVQELLKEVVSVNDNKTGTENKNGISLSSKRTGDDVDEKTTGESAGGEETGGKAAAEGQEIQMKKARLVIMLDEVAGSGSARTYTSLALETISKQFRSLKDAIIGQIKAFSKYLGQEEPKLKFLDHNLRHGMVQQSNNAWRPQRGLPERAVTVLRAWLFDHFLHPYPKDSDKIMLAKQTGLTRSQVSNWFINARVRLWKPMVEEMYVEETKDQDKNNDSTKEKISPNVNQDEDSMPKSVGYIAKQEKIPVSEVPQNSFMNNNGHSSSISISVPLSASVSETGFSILGVSEFEGNMQGNPKKLRTDELLHSPELVPSMEMDADKVGEVRNDNISPRFRDEKEFPFFANNTNFIGGFGPYPICETGRFEAEEFTPSYSGNINGVSLTLGLPHCESFSVSATHQNFFPNQNIQIGRNVEMSEPNEFGASEPRTSPAAYNPINLQNQRRFLSQLLPDFVT
ncbi:PREDICTED: BEL1-like homeodomain protein 1 isoform X2 [Tarenaya hassleriana]|uniref:BEL1-like homeodomain protein 1 isoform X2 n=1 Tax=Tarenaya hassleriana TaxID=28532 RepID=UPI00053C7339|nr:PREDICTED: BEL1-like homeodomain protein 1 isoform X2 [Tarenaya hassleriana]